MFLYLMRHGHAVSEMQDPERPLSEPGRESVRKIAGILAASFRFLPGHIYHSPKQRAAQTASLVSRTIPEAPAAVVGDGLLPMDDPGLWAERIQGAERDLLLVGHLPHLSRLASLLLLWDLNREIVDFTPGTVLCLEKTGSWKVRWMVSPEVLKKT